MIAVSSKGQSFRALAAYLAAGRSGHEHDRVAWSTGRNLPTDDPEIAAKLMRATAQHNHRVQKPVYHLALSFDPTDQVDRARMEQIADRVLARLGLREHQAVIVSHQDKGHPHLHILVNRVHPETHRVWDLSHDYRKIQQILRETEREFGLREVPGTLGWLPDHEAPDHAPLRNAELRTKARTGADPLIERARALVPELRTAESWAGFEARLERHGLSLHEKGQGFVISDGRYVVKASRVARDLSKRSLEARFGIPYTDRDHPIHEGTPAAVARDIRRYHYVTWMTEQQYTTELAVLDARGAHDRTHWNARHSDQLSKDFETALAQVYRDPAAARHAMLNAASDKGVSWALGMLRHQPEQYGALRTVPRPKLAGLLVTQDDGPARHAARQVVTAARAFLALEHSPSRDPGHDVAATLRLVRHAEQEAARRQQEFRGLPTRKMLEELIARGVTQLLPRELATLRMMLSSPDYALTQAVKHKLRDLALGDDRER